jgi:hypothetical protein
MSTPGDYSTLVPDFAPSTEANDFWAGGGTYEGKLGPWAVMRLNGRWFPGQTNIDSVGVIPVFIDDGEKSYKEDKQKVRGLHGHRQIYNGYVAARFVVRCRIMTPAQWAAFKAYLPVIDPEIRSSQYKALAGKASATKAASLAAQTKAKAAQAALDDLVATEKSRYADAGFGGVPLAAQVNQAQAQLLAAEAAAKQAQAAQSSAADKSCFDVEHPMLNAYAITKVDIIKVGFPREADGRFVRDVALLMQQVVALKDVGSRVVAPSAGLNIGVNATQVISREVPGATVDGQVFAEKRRP